MSDKTDLQNAINSLTKQDFEKELEILANDPNRLKDDLKKVVEKLSEKEVEQGVEKYGSVEAFLETLVAFLAFKAALIRKGVKVGLAAGGAAAILFGTGALCHSVADAIGVAAIADIGDGIDTVGDLSLDIADAGLEVAANGIDFFGGIVTGILSILGLG